MLSAAAAAIVGFAVFATFNPISSHNVIEAAPSKVTQGALRVLSQKEEVNLECPLKRTDVQAEISGSLARVNVTQEFQNPLAEKIEAVYVFPLPQNAAVDDMTMQVGDRTVKGKIKRREEARAIYDAARQAGQVAGLLDQERPNIFTQSVANITPGATVKVTISYVEFLKYDEGTYEFVFPMVVGPRYIPGAAIGQQSTGFAPDTSQVPDASRITPKVAPAGTRAGHDISLSLTLDAGVPIDSLRCASHEVNTTRPAGNQAVVQLRNEAVIPNKDFVLKFDVAGRKISDAILTHRGLPHTNGGGFFSMIFQPPDRVTAADVTPKELVFVLDTSGSMHGFPIEKAKETMALALDALYPGDTFNLITFAGDTHLLFPQPRPATRENLRLAQRFLASRQGSGGTEMMAAIRAALEPSDKQDHVRIVCFMTDGYVGNDMEILSEVQKHPNARVFSFGIGSSVNRFLLDKMAEASRGEVEYVALTDDGSAAAKRFHERVRNPLMTDIELDWSGLPVADVYPKRLPDLFSAKPLILTGRYTAGARGVVRLKGRLAGQVFTREIPVELPETQPQHDVLATLWARTRIDDLMSHDYAGIQNGNPQADVREAITQLGLEYRLMTQFTSFVAVEETVITDGGQPRRIDVPVELPEGVSRKGVFGEEDEKRSAMTDAQQVLGLHGLKIAPYAAVQVMPPPPSSTPIPVNAPTSIHLSEGVLAGSATRKPKPAYPAIAKSARVSGAVQVQVTVNESGQVVDAKVIGGHPLLRAAALDAARQWTFKPVELSGKPVKASGIIRFNFNGGQPAATSGASRPLTPLPEEQRRQQALAKLHPSVAAVVARLASGAAPAADEARFVSNGKAEVQIRLRVKSAATIEQLKRIGVEVLVNSSASKTIVGRLPIGKLMALAELAAVRDVAPLTK
jgi:Ca-activated chloride channel family protein